MRPKKLPIQRNAGGKRRPYALPKKLSYKTLLKMARRGEAVIVQAHFSEIEREKAYELERQRQMAVEKGRFNEMRARSNVDFYYRR